MKQLLAGFSVLAAAAVAISYAAAPSKDAPAVTWSPQGPSIVVPSQNIDTSAWEPYKARNPAPIGGPAFG
ncbi:MAG: hypothetical protein WDO12_05660 [Pseudomonadota bacterium]